MIKTTLQLGSTLLALVCAASVHAAPQVFFGENQNPGQKATGAPADARTSFLAYLTGSVGTETFELQATGGIAPLGLTFPGSAGNITATLTGGGKVFESSDIVLDSGRFNTTGAGAALKAGKWWEASGSFAIEFSLAVSAFGFYGTDIGDFAGQVTVTLLGTDDVPTTLNTGNTVRGADASLMFWGFVDTAKSYKKITFGNTNQTGTDVFGFDDMVIGDREQILPPGQVPEPGVLALVAIGLLGAGAIRRRNV